MMGSSYEPGVSQSPPSEDWGLHKARNWKLKLCWTRPRTCFLSGEPLWGKQAYYGVRVITGPGEPVLEDYWIKKEEFIIWKLKGN